MFRKGRKHLFSLRLILGNQADPVEQNLAEKHFTRKGWDGPKKRHSKKRHSKEQTRVKTKQKSQQLIHASWTSNQ